LLGHEQFPIAKGDNLAIRNPMNRMYVLVGDLAASDERDPQDARGW
jgi:hypothetical protein